MPNHATDKLQRRVLPNTDFGTPRMRSIPAWFVSFLLHSCLVIGLGTFWSSQPKGTSGEQDRQVGIAVVYESSQGAEYYLSDSSGAGDTSGGGQSQAAALAESLPEDNYSETAIGDALDGLLPNDDVGADLGSAAGDIGLGEGGGEIQGNREFPKAKTTVFGIEGEGSRFVYVFDRSASMQGYQGRPLQAAKAELINSLDSLDRVHQFQIIFYNESPLPFGGLDAKGPRLMRGTERDKRSASQFVRKVAADGGTQHLDAIRMALAMAPDVIFFLTDADKPELSSRTIEDLHRRTARISATLHCIQFGTGPRQGRGSWIEHLATGSGGQYRYVDTRSLMTKSR